MSKSGVHNPDIIDLVSYNANTGIVSLAMLEERDWQMTQQRYRELEAKIQNYVSFILDGQMAETYPQHVDKPVEIRLFCSTLPDSSLSAFFEDLRSRLESYSIGFRISQLK